MKKLVALLLVAFLATPALALDQVGPKKIDGSSTSAGAAAPLTLSAPTAASVPLTLAGATSQTANLLSIKDGAGVEQTFVYSDGGFHASWLEVGTGGQTDSGIFINYSGYVGTDSGLTWASSANKLIVGESGTGEIHTRDVVGLDGTKLTLSGSGGADPGPGEPTTPGQNVEIYGGIPTLSYDTLGAAKGGDITLTAGYARRYGTGTAPGGIIKLEPGYGVGGGKDGTVRIVVDFLPVYADNAAATTGGLVSGDLYRTSAGVLMVRY